MKRLLILLLLVSQPSWAQQSVSFITRCSAMSGYSYHPEQPRVAKKDSGFGTDKFSGGQTLLVRTGEDELDIIFTDSTKKTQSSRDSGGKVVPLSVSDKGILILVYYEDAVLEVYNFSIDLNGTGEVILTQSKIAGPLKKSGLYRASCTR
jgi:hypothetical protein